MNAILPWKSEIEHFTLWMHDGSSENPREVSITNNTSLENFRFMLLPGYTLQESEQWGLFIHYRWKSSENTFTLEDYLDLPEYKVAVTIWEAKDSFLMAAIDISSKKNKNWRNK